MLLSSVGSAVNMKGEVWKVSPQLQGGLNSGLRSAQHGKLSRISTSPNCQNFSCIIKLSRYLFRLITLNFCSNFTEVLHYLHRHNMTYKIYIQLVTSTSYFLVLLIDFAENYTHIAQVNFFVPEELLWYFLYRAFQFICPSRYRS